MFQVPCCVGDTRDLTPSSKPSYWGLLLSLLFLWLRGLGAIPEVTRRGS